MTQDIYLRAHTVVPGQQSRGMWREEEENKWPARVLVFDTETTIDTRQGLTVGCYRTGRLVDGV